MIGRIIEYMPKLTIQEVKAQVDTHEAVCEERYINLNKRLQKLESIVIGSAAATIMLLIGIILK
tara:strand:- start:982 stop:1173 length:192 start_codon:yes stop_codon:yes gene_type:complete